MKTIQDLLRSIQQNVNDRVSLDNNKNTWRKIGERDRFSELGLNSSELEDFLKEWVSDNEYSNIK